MVDKEIDRQNGDAEQNKGYLIYVLIGLLIFSLILIILLFVMCRYIKGVPVMRIKAPEDKSNRTRFYKKEPYEPVVKSSVGTYDARGPIVRRASYEDAALNRERILQGNEITDTVDRTLEVKIPAIISK